MKTMRVSKCARTSVKAEVHEDKESAYLSAVIAFGQELKRLGLYYVVVVVDPELQMGESVTVGTSRNVTEAGAARLMTLYLEGRDKMDVLEHFHVKEPSGEVN